MSAPITVLRTDVVRYREELDEAVKRLGEMHAAGKLASIVAVYYDTEGVPYTWATRSVSLKDWSYGLDLLWNRLQACIGGPE